MSGLSPIPALQLSSDRLNDLVKKDDPQSWKDFAAEAKDKAKGALSLQLYNEAGGWLYSSLAAEMFAADLSSISPALKRELLLDLHAFLDFYETIKPEDDINAAAEVLEGIYKSDPENTLRYLRAALALSLIYDRPSPTGWPQTCMPESPSKIKSPLEVFAYFITPQGAESKTVFPLQNLTVGELIWVMGVAGPVEELERLRRPKMTPFELDRMTSHFKTDKDRLVDRKWTVWPSGREFTLDNLRKYGAIPSEKVFFSWRTANASGIPCLYFAEYVNEDDPKYRIPAAWITYMARPGLWKFEVARSGNKSMYGRPLDPQTWKDVMLFDIYMLHRRHIVSKNGIESFMFLRFSEMLFDGGDFHNAAIFADKAKKSNSENWKAYHAFINARTKFGAGATEIDATWRKSFEAFRRYPDQCIFMLKFYRNHLKQRGNKKEANRLFVAEMRAVMREDPGLYFNIYVNELKEIFDELEDKTEIFSVYTDVLRMASNIEKECFDRIVTPLAKLFNDSNDRKSALRTIRMFESAFRPKSDTMKNSVQLAKELYASRGSRKNED